MAVKDVGALTMMSWPILCESEYCVSDAHPEEGWGADVRLGEVVLRDVEKAARDGLEGPELGEPEALEVDDDERLAYWSTGGGGCGWEDLGEDGLDVDEDRAPVFLRGYALVEPLGAYRTEALDVYRTAELYTMERSDVGTDRRRARTEFTLSVWKESGDQPGAEHGNARGRPPSEGKYCITACAYLVEAHWPALKDSVPPGKLCGRAGNGGKVRRVSKERKRGAHCAHRKDLCSGKAPLSRRLPPCAASGCNQGSSASPGTHCIRGPSGSACVCHNDEADKEKKVGGEVGQSMDGTRRDETNVSVWSSFGKSLSK